jgi:hypothetical protein
MEMYQQERVRLERELESAREPKTAADSLCVSMERMRIKYREYTEDAGDRAEIDRLFDVAKQSIRCMPALSGMRVNVVRDEPHAVTAADKITALLPLLGALIGAVLTAWLLIEDMYTAALLSTALTAVAWLETQAVYRRRIAVAAEPRIDAHDLIRMMDRVMEAIEDAADREAQSRKKLPSAEVYLSEGGCALNHDMLASVQMLLEAGQSRDGAYALKALPQLKAALRAEGIEEVMYSEQTAAYFDLYPSVEAGITIRPALMKDGKILCRGQATEALE